MKTHIALAWIQKVLYGLAIIASLLLVTDVAAPWLIAEIFMPFKGFLQTLPEVEATIIVYLVLQALTIIGLLFFLRFFNAKITDLGIGKMRRWYLILLTPLIIVVYTALTIATSILIGMLFPGYNPTEKQEIGLSPDGSHNLFLTAIFIGVLVPLAEEFAFRGYLFGLLRKKFSFVPVAVITSLAFAVLHMLFDTTSGVLVVKHLNVAVDVFILSLFFVLPTRTNWKYLGQCRITWFEEFHRLFISFRIQYRVIMMYCVSYTSVSPTVPALWP